MRESYEVLRRWNEDHEPIDVGRVNAKYARSAAVGGQLASGDSATQGSDAQAGPLSRVGQRLELAAGSCGGRHTVLLSSYVRTDRASGGHTRGWRFVGMWSTASWTVNGYSHRAEYLGPGHWDKVKARRFSSGEPEVCSARAQRMSTKLQRSGHRSNQRVTTQPVQGRTKRIRSHRVRSFTISCGSAAWRPGERWVDPASAG